MDFMFVLFFIFAVANAEYISYKDYKVYKIVPETENQVQVLTDLQDKSAYQFWSDVVKLNSDVRIMVSPEKLNDFEELMKTAEVNYKVAIEDVQKLIDDQLRRPKLNRLNNDYAWNYYQTLQEINEWLDQTAEAHPDVVTLVTIGQSIEGRDIRGVIIDFKKQLRPTIGMLEGGIHAREWLSPATLTWIINEFLTSDDPEIRLLAENIVWHIFPVTNPDGYVYTFTDNRMWRKNRNPASTTSCAQWGLSDDISRGVDLNRNFDYLWMTVGASSNPCAETYAGTIPSSELETRSIINYINQIQQDGELVYYFAFHTYSQMVLVPYSHLSGSDVLGAPNYGDMYEIAIKGMDRLRERNGTEYLVGTSSDILYGTSGGSFDWVHRVAKVPIVYLFELRDTGIHGFLYPPERIIDNNREIVDALVEMDRVTREIGYYRVVSGDVVTRISTLLLVLGIVFTYAL